MEQGEKSRTTVEPGIGLFDAAEDPEEPAVMEEQLRRMLKDARMRGMAAEFGARWLGVRDFVTNHGRNLKHFPEFTPAVRDALAEEPVRFFEDLLVNDRPVADVIAADAVVVNDVLAQYYGVVAYMIIVLRLTQTTLFKLLPLVHMGKVVVAAMAALLAIKVLASSSCFKLDFDEAS